MYPWYLGLQTQYTEEMLKQCIEGDDLKKSAKLLYQHLTVLKERLPNTLFKLLKRGTELCIQGRISETQAKGFLVEVCAAFEFQYQNPTAGKISYLFVAIAKYPHLAHHLSDRCSHIKTIDPKNGKQWFHTRICVMDIFTGWKILDSDADWKIFYGGLIHAQYLKDILFLEGTKCTDYDSLDDIAFEFPIYYKILNKNKNSRITLMGENHTNTKMSFSEELIKFANNQCSNNLKIDIFVEKHPSNGKDKIQRHLSCSLKNNVALQNFRCSENLPTCSNVNIVHSDVRHVEMGFLRYEVLSLDTDEEFRKLSFEFQEECLSYLQGVAAMFM